jgi:NAD(P)H-dependent flavin oxidoreductase YrpB (nitropropane dioxygenase family)
VFKTRFTELLGIQYAIMQGALAWLSRAELVAAVSNAGGIGTLTLGGLTDTEHVRNEIRKVKTLTDKPFAVNVGFQPRFTRMESAELANILIQEKVKAVEIYEALSKDLMIPLKANGVVMIQKGTSMESARVGVANGADVIGLYTYGAGGHPNVNEITPLVQIPKAVREFKIPVLASGGIANAAGFVAALSLGADGVIMGTRFLMAKECPLHPVVREWMCKSSECDTMLLGVPSKRPARRIRNRAAEEILRLEAEGAPAEKITELMSGARVWKSMAQEGDIGGGSLGCGQAIGLIDDVLSSREIITGMVAEAVAIVSRLDKLAGKP